MESHRETCPDAPLLARRRSPDQRLRAVTREPDADDVPESLVTLPRIVVEPDETSGTDD